MGFIFSKFSNLGSEAKPPSPNPSPQWLRQTNFSNPPTPFGLATPLGKTKGFWNCDIVYCCYNGFIGFSEKLKYNVELSSSSSHPTSPPLFHGMCQHDHCCDLLLHCHYVFLLEKPKCPSPNHFHLLPRVFGISSQVIFHLFPLFLLSGRNSSTIFFEVPFPVIPHHPLASRFVMSAHPQMRLRSDTPHRLANMFQLSAYD